MALRLAPTVEKETSLRRDGAGNVKIFEGGRLVFVYTPELVKRTVDQIVPYFFFRFARVVPVRVAIEADWRIRRSLAASALHADVWSSEVSFQPRIGDIVDDMAAKHGVWQQGKLVAWKNEVFPQDRSKPTYPQVRNDTQLDAAILAAVTLSAVILSDGDADRDACQIKLDVTEQAELAFDCRDVVDEAGNAYRASPVELEDIDDRIVATFEVCLSE